MCIVAATGQCGILQNNILHDSASESDTYANSSSTKMIRNIRKQTHSDRWRHSISVQVLNCCTMHRCSSNIRLITSIIIIMIILNELIVAFVSIETIESQSIRSRYGPRMRLSYVRLSCLMAHRQAADKWVRTTLLNSINHSILNFMLLFDTYYELLLGTNWKPLVLDEIKFNWL